MVLLRQAPNLLMAALIAAVIGCGSKREVVISGETMGTRYQVTVVAGYLQRTSQLPAAITTLLGRLNRSMSTYEADSEISRFNRLDQADTRFKVSEDMARVMAEALALCRLTGGAWDATVHPLVNLWGFGSQGGLRRMPSEAEIRNAREHIGCDRIELVGGKFLIKKDAMACLDLASIAKGFAVDRVAELIRSRGFKNFLVEIGGEVYASGRRLDGRPWRVGINVPIPGAPADGVYRALALSDMALATSGDYRNFFEIDGTRYSHVIDPRTGYPVSNGVVSVSVLAANCMLADGLATALMVLGPTRAMRLAEDRRGVEALMVVAQPDGDLKDLATSGFKPAVEPMPDL